MPNRQTLEHLLSTMSLEREDALRFTAQNTHPDGPRLYGGQVLAQAIRAAQLTVESDRVVHSQHAYFLRPGDGKLPLTLDVEVARDGGSFSSRRVVASQQGRVILVSSMSFHTPESGDEYGAEMPAVTGPDGLRTQREINLEEDFFWPEFQIVDGLDWDIRFVEPVDWHNPVPREGVLHIWLKTTGSVGALPGMQPALLSYISDCGLIDATLLPFGRSFYDGMQTASLDHAMWFHAPCQVQDWLLYEVSCERVGAARGLARGRFFNQDGSLIATCMQECLQRRLQ
ncbi:MAG: acyl-CoA thioesterase domain-containing protein [Pseudomonadota bacterium]